MIENAPSRVGAIAICCSLLSACAVPENDSDRPAARAEREAVTGAAPASGSDGPFALDDRVTVPQDGFVDVAVLDNDSCLAQGPVILTVNSAPAHGVAAVNDDLTIAYRADAGFTGQDSFDYTATDSAGGSASARVNVWVGADGKPTMPKGSVTLTWTAPTKDVAGGSVGQLAGYRIYYWKDGESDAQVRRIDVTPGCRTVYTVVDLEPGSYRFSVSAIDSNNAESLRSTETTKTIE